MCTFQYLPLLFVLLFLQCFSPPNAAGQFTEQEFDQMADNMAKGEVQDISVAELRQRKDDVILLDTRERREYDISHIQGARWVGYDDFMLDRVKDLPKDQPVITYCSVGYRSERIGEKLQEAGFKEVYNLKGSIFKWVNEGHPIVDDKNEPTDKIHGYDQKWGKWLKKGEVVY